METNCKNNNINSKYNVDHVYCHSNENNYIRAGSLDIMALLKENKQLKAMLLLHLDMIQDQSDQLLAKDKILAGLRDENESLKAQVDRYERSYGTCGGATSNTTSTKTFSKNFNSCKTADLQQVKKLLASRIEEKKENLRDFTNVETKTINKKCSSIDEEKKPDKIIVANAVATRCQQTPSPTTNQLAAPQQQQQQQQPTQENKYKICDGYLTNSSSIIGQSNGKLISKIILHRVQIPDCITIPKKDTDMNNTDHEDQQDDKSILLDIMPSKPTVEEEPETSPNTSILFTKQTAEEEQSLQEESDDEITEAHDEIEIKSEQLEDTYCFESYQDKIIADQPIAESSSYKIECKTNSNGPFQIKSAGGSGDAKRKCNLLTTRKRYSAREWIDEEIPPQEWSNKEEEKALKADAPMLEVPKWTVKEFSGLYSIEGTEDLSDEAFLKRHAKLEHDEKRRKKWDAQRIREQRTIERLKRRHCKDELQDNETQDIVSFYSTPDSIKFIQISEELPVQAFGEGIPTLSSGEFHLPWMQRHQQQQQQNDMLKAMAAGGGSYANSLLIQHSSFIFLKKRRRQQSVTVNSLRRKSALNINMNSVLSSNAAVSEITCSGPTPTTATLLKN